MSNLVPPDSTNPGNRCQCWGPMCPNCPCADRQRSKSKRARLVHGVAYTLLVLLLAWSQQQHYHEEEDRHGNRFLFRMGWTDASTKVWIPPNRAQLRAFWEHADYMRSEAAQRDADRD